VAQTETVGDTVAESEGEGEAVAQPLCDTVGDPLSDPLALLQCRKADTGAFPRFMIAIGIGDAAELRFAFADADLAAARVDAERTLRTVIDLATTRVQAYHRNAPTPFSWVELFHEREVCNFASGMNGEVEARIADEVERRQAAGPFQGLLHGERDPGEVAGDFPELSAKETGGLG
jgi:hypothetical protein